MPTSPNRVAANQANARRSTGPKTPEGRARSSQNARKLPFDPNPFAIVRIEDRARIASLVAGAVATYQPVNSQERLAVERIALAQHAMRRMYTLEAGFFTNCLDTAMAGPADPFILNQSELGGADIALEQHRAYWLAFGFNRYTQRSNVAATLLRFQAQAERLYRRAVEDFDRLFKLRGQLPPEKYQENEPNSDPVADPQPDENTADSALIAQPLNEPNAEPGLTADGPRHATVPGKRLARATSGRHALHHVPLQEALGAVVALATSIRHPAPAPTPAHGSSRRNQAGQLRRTGQAPMPLGLGKAFVLILRQHDYPGLAMLRHPPRAALPRPRVSCVPCRGRSRLLRQHRFRGKMGRMTLQERR
jgi:hypothetical protein